jgi:hypothetical protein
MKYLCVFLLLSSFAWAGRIHELAAQGDVEGVKKLLAAWTLVDDEDEQGRTPLIHAVMAGQYTMVRFLLMQEADPLYQVRMGQHMQNPWTLAQRLVRNHDTPNSRNILLLLGLRMQGPLRGPVDPQLVALYENFRRQIHQAVTIDAEQKKNIVRALETAIESLAPDVANSIEHQALFYQFVQLMWQVKEKQEFWKKDKKEICLSCFKSCKIARSHYISRCILKDIGGSNPLFLDPWSSQWSTDDANSIVASPLCCQGGSTDFCEQHFSPKEKAFSDAFLKKDDKEKNDRIPFAIDLREQVRRRGAVNIRLDYGPYLYYVAVLHAYRIMLNNFAIQDNWAAMETVEDVATFPAIIRFIDDMRQFLIDRSGSARSTVRVMLFVNSDGIIKKNGLAYGHFKQAFPEHTGVIAHFGFQGLHFVIVDGAQTMNKIDAQFRIPNMQRFDISPTGGSLQITQSGPANWPVPPYLQSLLDHFEAGVVKSLGRVDRERIQRPDVQSTGLIDQKHFVLLPEYVTLDRDDAPRFITKDPIEFRGQNNCDYLFYKPLAESWFVIGTRHLDAEHKATLGFRFDYDPARAYAENCQQRNLPMDFDELATVLRAEPWGRKSHGSVKYYPEFPAELIGPVLSDYVRQNPQSSNDWRWQWYTDTDVDDVLRLRLQEENLGENQNVIRLPSLGGTHMGTQLRTHLNDEMTRNQGLIWDRTILLPFNIGNQHWIGLVIRIQSGRVSVEYYDSLSEQPEIPLWVFTELYRVYGEQVSITAAANLLQMDTHSCGPLMVENLVQRALGVRNQRPRFVSHDAGDVRAHHRSLITSGNWPDPSGITQQMGSFFAPYAIQAAWIFAALFPRFSNSKEAP